MSTIFGTFLYFFYSVQSYLRELGRGAIYIIMYAFDSFKNTRACKYESEGDVGNIEAMSKERWGAAKWVKGQLRMYCVNDFDVQREPKDAMPIRQNRAGQHGFVSHQDFMAMLGNAWFSREANLLQEYMSEILQSA